MERIFHGSLGSDRSIDRSASTEEIVARDFEEWKRLLERSKPSRNDRLLFVDYAAEVVTKPNTETATYPGNRLYLCMSNASLIVGIEIPLAKGTVVGK
jgi:hypothetical protein